MQRGGAGNGTGHAVHLHADVIGIGIVADLLHLGNAAHNAQVRLRYVDSPVLNELLETPQGADALAGGSAGLHIVVEFLEVAVVHGLAGLLIVQAAILVQLSSDLDRGVHVGHAVEFDNDADVVAHSIPDGAYPVRDGLKLILGVQLLPLPVGAVGAVDALGTGAQALVICPQGIHLHSGEALGDGAPGLPGIVLRLYDGVVYFTPAQLDLAGVSLDLGIELAAQQLVHRQVRSLALDVPQGDVQSADGRKGDGSAAISPVRAVVQLLPDHLVIQGVHPQNEGRDLGDHGHGGIPAGHNGDPGFAPAADALIGVDAHTNGEPTGCGGFHNRLENVNACDLHSRSSFLNSCSCGFISAARSLSHTRRGP